VSVFFKSFSEIPKPVLQPCLLLKVAGARVRDRYCRETLKPDLLEKRIPVCAETDVSWLKPDG
jgi:hypothetical protein